jgi:hypothetical protein
MNLEKYVLKTFFFMPFFIVDFETKTNIELILIITTIKSFYYQP